jgi:hypothetical protein
MQLLLNGKTYRIRREDGSALKNASTVIKPCWLSMAEIPCDPDDICWIAVHGPSPFESVFSAVEYAITHSEFDAAVGAARESMGLDR